MDGRSLYTAYVFRQRFRRVQRRFLASFSLRAARSGTVAGAWHSGYQRIFVLWIVRARPTFLTWSPTTFTTLALGVFISSIPALVNQILILLSSPAALVRRTELNWLWGFASVDFIIILASVGAWTFVARKTDDIDNLVNDPSDAAVVSSWLDRWLSWQRQAAAPLLSASGAFLFLLFAQEPLSPFLHVSLASYLSVIWTAVIGGNALYWLYVAPGMVGAIAKCSNLSLWWQNPAMTPALRVLSDGLAFAASALLAGGFCITFLGFFGPQTIQVPLIQLVLVGFFIVVMLSAVQVVLAPTLHIYRIIRNKKLEVLRKISEEVGDLDRVLRRERSYDVEFSSLFLAVAQTQNLPFATSTVVQYSAGFTATIIGFVISQITK